MKSLLACAAVWLGMLAASAPVWAVTVAGVAYTDSLDQRGTVLQLNGAGVRYKAVFKVYAAGLYLPKKASTPEDVMAMPGPKRISITMLREIDANELGKLFTRGVEDNTGRGELSKLVPSLYRMGQVFAEQKKLLPGDTFELDWMPGVGTVLLVKGKPQGEPFPEAEFFNALLRIWLGPSPADWKLKDALLGKAG
ncbi:chalcone isomerase family protein [Rhodoferax sp.]|uniref:chalcone isomerase family protein n=1 Tax=Rhodoferax sp. TaxID=50421 RepID=UPI0025E0AD94|nr:chalcone isomerase family protein [Rhodoferax sp.]